MKKKEIVICFIGIIVISLLLIFLVNKKSNMFMQDGVVFALTIDGEKANTFPQSGQYYADINCQNGVGIYYYDESASAPKFAVKKITGNVSCEIDFTSNPDTLKEIVEDNATNEAVSEIFLGSNDYTSYYSQTQNGNASTAFVFNSSSNTWVFTPSNYNTAYTNILTFIPPDLGKQYRVCVTPFNGTVTAGVSASATTVGHVGLDLTSPTEVNCSSWFQIPLGTTSNRYIVMIFQGNSNTTAFSYYVQKKVTGSEYDFGYRYEGKNPNNYVWFNNEMWRIIGEVPTCTSSGCATSENLVKIIRSQGINSAGYNSSSPAPAWGQSGLFTLLNTYYLGKSDATSQSICVGTSSSKPNCNYSIVGINPTGYYGNMIENVYWNTGNGAITLTPLEMYQAETATQTTQAKIGIMSASDYGFGTPNHSGTFDAYNVALTTSTNWLYGTGQEQIVNNSTTDTTKTLTIYMEGNLEDSNVMGTYVLRPVVYLDPSVYVISGNGTEETPYQLGI